MGFLPSLMLAAGFLPFGQLLAAFLFELTAGYLHNSFLEIEYWCAGFTWFALSCLSVRSSCVGVAVTRQLIQLEWSHAHKLRSSPEWHPFCGVIV